MDLPTIAAPDDDARRAALARGNRAGALGRLAEFGGWLAAAQATYPPRAPERPRIVVVAADHGIAAAGVSADPPSATAARLAAARDHTAPVAVTAPVAGASLRLVDAGVAGGPQHVRTGSGRIDREDALTAAEVERAVTIGRALADEEVDSGTDLLAAAALGVGATTPASVLVAALTGTEPVAVVGRGSGIDDACWMRKATAVRDALRRAKPHAHDPLALLRVAGGADLAVLAGFLLQAAARRTPVLIDGLVAGAAALLADTLAPGACGWWLAADRSPEPAAALVLARLGHEPVLDLGTRLGDGTGAAAAIPLVRMAARLLAETDPPAGPR